MEQEEQKHDGIVFFSINPYGIDWFDKIIREDEQLIKFSSTMDLFAVDNRLRELEAEHNIPNRSKPKSDETES